MKIWAPIATTIGQSVRASDSVSFDMIGLIGATDAGWYKMYDLSSLKQDSAGTIAVTTSGDLVGLRNDLSGNGNNATASGSARGAYYEQYGKSYLQLDYVDDAMAWPFNGVTGTYGFASIHGAQVGDIVADALMPRTQDIESVFIARTLNAGEKASLLAYLKSKCPTTKQTAELLTTDYNHYWVNRDDNPAGSFVMTFSDGQTAEAPPWDLPDLDTVLTTCDRARRGLRIISGSVPYEFLIDSYDTTQTTSIIPNLSSYVGAETIEINGFIQGFIPAWSNFPSSGVSISIGLRGNVGGGMCGGIPSLATLPSNITKLFIITPGVKWATFDLTNVPATLQKLALAYITTSGAMPVLSGLTDLIHLDLRHTTFTSGSMPTVPLQLEFLDMENTGRTGLAPNPGRFTVMERYHFRGNALTGFDEAITFNAATDYINLVNNNMSSAVVNSILAAHVLANPTTAGKKYKRLNLEGASMGSPTGQGIVDKATIISRGWTCTTS